MKEWLKQKLTEYTSRKFIGFIMTEAAVIYLAKTGVLTDSWSILVGVVGPFILYEFVNGALHLQNLKINLPQVQLNGKDPDEN